MAYESVNPATGRLLERFPTAGDDEMSDALAGATTAFDGWRGRPRAERAEWLEAAAALLEERKGELARTMALEMGKPLAEGEAEAVKSARGCRYYAERAERFLDPVERESDGSFAEVRFDPLGPILAIMPWNFPFWQFFRFAAPALMAGNTVLLKHAPRTPRCALAIERLMADAGFPRGAVRSLFLEDTQVARLIGDPRLRGVTLTGSTRAGSCVAETAGRHLKPMVMELGGSDPFLVFGDADVAAAAAAGALSRCQNSGQSCIAAKRFLVHVSRFDEFLERLVQQMRARQVGDPLDPAVHVGPLAREDLRATLAAQVERTLDDGARAICGGAAPPGEGFFYPPTILVEVAADSPAATEELFGPVAPVIPFEDDTQAVALANATRFGLGASVWTAAAERAGRLAAEIEAGSVFVNGMVKSDPRLPFGGVKDSGFGRELGREGLLEFVNVKTVWTR